MHYSYNELLGYTPPTPWKSVKRRGKYWVISVGKHLYADRAGRIKEEVAQWLNTAADNDWHLKIAVETINNQYCRNLKLYVPARDVVIQFQLTWQSD